MTPIRCGFEGPSLKWDLEVAKAGRGSDTPTRAIERIKRLCSDFEPLDEHTALQLTEPVIVDDQLDVETVDAGYSSVEVERDDFPRPGAGAYRPEKYFEVAMDRARGEGPLDHICAVSEHACDNCNAKVWVRNRLRR